VVLTVVLLSEYTKTRLRSASWLRRANPLALEIMLLGHEDQDPDELRALLGQPAEGHLHSRPVSTAVNNGPQLLDELAA
jgi:hypothetical protein